MNLRNFGGILNFAAELEAGDAAFYQGAARNPAFVPWKGTFEEFVKEHQRNEQEILRIRRENVTEMMLEPIHDFTKAPFVMDRAGADRAELEAVLEMARKLETRSEQYYREAAEKIKALPEVARGLKSIGKKHASRQEKLSGP